jgi:hypothetical protein
VLSAPRAHATPKGRTNAHPGPFPRGRTPPALGLRFGGSRRESADGLAQPGGPSRRQQHTRRAHCERDYGDGSTPRARHAAAGCRARRCRDEFRHRDARPLPLDGAAGARVDYVAQSAKRLHAHCFGQASRSRGVARTHHRTLQQRRTDVWRAADGEALVLFQVGKRKRGQEALHPGGRGRKRDAAGRPDGAWEKRRPCRTRLVRRLLGRKVRRLRHLCRRCSPTPSTARNTRA